MLLRSATCVRLALLSFVTLGVLCVTYGYIIEPRWPEVHRLRVVTSKVERGRSFRLVQISDLHSGRRTVLEDRLPDLISAEHPDLVVFTGDLLNDLDGLPKARRMFARMAIISPVFAIPGNADDRLLGSRNPYVGVNVHYLQNEIAEVNARDTRVRLIGTVTEHSSAIELLQNQSGDGFTILLHHCPQLLPVAVDSNRVDLFLSGHTHGGQVALPLFGPVIAVGGTPNLHGKGLYRQGEMYAHVNVGLGTSKAFPIRFLVRPEISVIDVVSAH